MACFIQVPMNSGEAVDRVITALWVYQAAQDETQTLKVQN